MSPQKTQKAQKFLYDASLPGGVLSPQKTQKAQNFFFAASLRSSEFGRAADAAQARASPASLTDGGDAVGTSRASARRTSGPVVGIFRRFAARVAPPGLKPYCLRSGGSRRCATLHPRLIRGRRFAAIWPPRFARRNSVAPLTRRRRGLRSLP